MTLLSNYYDKEVIDMDKNQSLDQIFNDFKDYICSVTEYQYDKISVATSKLFRRYSEYIKLFFCDKEDEIKGIYQSIREDIFPFNKITSIDVNMAMHCYSDYFKGLIQFAKKVADLKDTDDIDPVSVANTIATVKSRDKDFIDSLFGGERNPEITADIDTSMVTVEAFIQLSKSFDEFDLVMHTITLDATKSNSKKYNEAVLDGLKVYAISVGYYNYRCLNEITQTYMKITNSMKSRTPAGGVKEVETYQLF